MKWLLSYSHAQCLNLLANVGLVYACVLVILWLNVSSHRSFSLPCQLICCWLWFHLPSQSQACPQDSVTSSLPAYSGVIKNLPCINIPISVLAVALQPARRLPEKHLITSGSDGLFMFLVYLRQRRYNKLITETGRGFLRVHVLMYACIWLHCILQTKIGCNLWLRDRDEASRRSRWEWLYMLMGLVCPQSASRFGIKLLECRLDVINCHFSPHFRSLTTRKLLLYK